MVTSWRPRPVACHLLPAAGSTFMSIRETAGWPVPSRVAEVARLRLWEFEGGALGAARA